MERFNPAFTASVAHLRDAKYIEAVRASGFTFRSTDVGVVLDLMIHDIDLVLSLVRSPGPPGRRARLLRDRRPRRRGQCATRIRERGRRFADASRVSYEPVRRMSVWTSRAYSSIDFASRKTSVVRPSQALLQRQFDVDSLTAEEIDHYREHLLEEHLPCETLQSEPIDALAAELNDFVESLRMPRQPRVTGEHGAEAVELAEQSACRDRVAPLGRYGRRACRPHGSGIRTSSPARTGTWRHRRRP